MSPGLWNLPDNAYRVEVLFSEIDWFRLITYLLLLYFVLSPQQTLFLMQQTDLTTLRVNSFTVNLMFFPNTFISFILTSSLRTPIFSWVWWKKPVIPAYGRLSTEELQVQGQSGLDSKILYEKQNKKSS